MGIPELTKEEYILFELAKAYITTRPNYHGAAISGDITALAKVILNPKTVSPDTDDSK
jgi:hypothetical protein